MCYIYHQEGGCTRLQLETKKDKETLERTAPTDTLRGQVESLARRHNASPNAPVLVSMSWSRSHLQLMTSHLPRALDGRHPFWYRRALPN